jgi:hypothetical protein
MALNKVKYFVRSQQHALELLPSEDRIGDDGGLRFRIKNGESINKYGGKNEF